MRLTHGKLLLGMLCVLGVASVHTRFTSKTARDAAAQRFARKDATGTSNPLYHRKAENDADR